MNLKEISKKCTKYPQIYTVALFFPPSCIIAAQVGSELRSFLAGAGGGRAAALLEHISNVVQRGEEAPASNGEVEKMFS